MRRSLPFAVFAAIGCFALTAPALASASIMASTYGQSGGPENTTTSVLVSGHAVTSDGSPYSWHFDYGTTTAYGSSTPGGPSTAAGPDGNQRETISGLTPGTTYHVRFVAQSAGGEQAFGADATAETGQAAPTPKLSASPRVDFFAYPQDIKEFVLGHRKNIFQASCNATATDRGDAFADGIYCSIHVEVTLTAKTAKAAHITNRRIANLEIPLTTQAEKNRSHDHQAGVEQTGGPVMGGVPLGLSSSVKKKLERLKSVTVTFRATYKLGSASAAPKALGEGTLTMTTRPNNQAHVILRNYRPAASNG